MDIRAYRIRKAIRYLKYHVPLTLAFERFEITHTSSLHNAENISSASTARQKRLACSIFIDSASATSPPAPIRALQEFHLRRATQER